MPNILYVICQFCHGKRFHLHFMQNIGMESLSAGFFFLNYQCYEPYKSLLKYLISCWSHAHLEHPMLMVFKQSRNLIPRLSNILMDSKINRSKTRASFWVDFIYIYIYTYIYIYIYIHIYIYIYIHIYIHIYFNRDGISSPRWLFHIALEFMVPFLALFEFYDDHLLNRCKMLIRSIAKVAVFLSY